MKLPYYRLYHEKINLLLNQTQDRKINLNNDLSALQREFCMQILTYSKNKCISAQIFSYVLFKNLLKTFYGFFSAKIYLFCFTLSVQVNGIKIKIKKRCFGI